MIQGSNRFPAWAAPLGGLLFVLISAAASLGFEIDTFSYPTAAAIRAAWQSGPGSPQTEIAKSGPWGSQLLGVFPCDFTGSDRERSYWDRTVSLDLSGYQCFALRLYCSNPGPVDVVTLYFHSQSGWYAESQDIGGSGWNTLVFQKGDFATEDDPAGWDRIDAIRLSPWRSTSQDTVIYADRLWAYSPSVTIVRARGSDEEGDEYVRPFREWLTRFKVSFGEISDGDVESGGLAGSRLAIFPYNGALSDGEVDRVRTFIAGGGKVWAFYDIDDRITDLLGVDQTDWTETEVSALSFTTRLPGMPKRVLQASWNFMIVASSQSATKVLARWEDDSGKILDYPALLNGPHGSYMSHVLLTDDPLRKQQMILALLMHDAPELAPGIARGVLDVLGEVALYKSFEQAYAGIAKLGPASLNPKDVADALAAAENSWTTAKTAFAQKRYPAVLSPAFAAHEALVKAYALCQRPRTGEFRAVWNHTGTGVWPGDWPRSARELKGSGFGAVFPNMLDGGRAHYPSKLLPRSDEFRRYGDQVAQCLAACRSAGLEMHVWKVDWNLFSAPPSFIREMRAADRTQVDAYGNDVDWLCPSNPLNEALERDSLLEVVSHYDVDGIHFDYIRYPDDTTCYCGGCRKRFEAYRGKAVSDWPTDCYSGSLRQEYRDWRCLQITRLVKDVHDRVKTIKPAVRISAAVFSDYPDCRESVGQDWLSWVRAGYLDFVLPMDYTSDSTAFAESVRRQIHQVGGRVPVRPGIGASSESLPVDRVIVQILETRKQKTGGFILFNYDRYLLEILSLLARGLTAPGSF
jgi:uncharacterized lipoprotein YddW (UPF0748 family)